MLALCDDLDNIVREDRENFWPEIKRKWFCSHDKCKIPGLLKIGN